MVSPSSSTSQAPRHAPVLGTLMPHLAADRHHVYRDVTALALLAALIAAGLGSLPVALVLTAVALPAAVLVYIHDHRLWHDEPITIIAVAFGLSLLLGIGVGVLQAHFVRLLMTGATSYYLPPIDRILQSGVLVPVVTFIAVVVAPLVVSSRPAFKHPFDVVVAASLSGAALSLGLSVMVQHAAFTRVEATSGDPAHVAFIALNLGFLQPIVLATAATVAVLGVRRLGVSPVVGVLEGLLLVVAYDLASTLLETYGSRGIVLTALTAFVLAGIGLRVARKAIHDATAADAGTPEHPAGASVEHHLHGGLVAAALAVVVVIAAVVSVAIIEGGPNTRPKPPKIGTGVVVPHTAAATKFDLGADPSARGSWGRVALASRDRSLAVATLNAIHLWQSVSITPAPGWQVAKQQDAMVLLYNSDQSVAMVAGANPADAPTIDQEAAYASRALFESNGMTNVQQEPSGPVTTLQGQNFQQLYMVYYTANLQTNQGSGQVYGVFGILFNPSAHTMGVIDAFSADNSELEASATDIGHMIGSMAN